MKIKRATHPTLTSRVQRHSLWLACAIFTLFSMLVIFIVFSLEDAILHDQLKQTYSSLEKGGVLPDNYTLVDNPSELSISTGEQLKYLEFDEEFGEFKQGEQHFHFLQTEQGTLILDSSALSITSRVIDDILILLLLMLVPTVILTYWFSAKLSKHAVRPFNLLLQALQSDDGSIQQVRIALDTIEEHDLKTVAQKLAEALERESKVLQEQISFNQGMAHEIRTPLQVMTHSVELLCASDPRIQKLVPYQRLNKAITRMHRISNALLWLTSQSQEHHTTHIIQAINRVVAESQTLINLHHIDIQIDTSPACEALEIDVPDVVFELVIFNLLNNVIQHCQTSEDRKYWQIDVTPSYVSFRNPLPTTNNDGKANQNFGLGLQLVTALLTRFNRKVSTKRRSNDFEVIIYLADTPAC
ncbi:hypothetical protein CHH28_00630 [Bacterioplanes sanyensis]|uniref:histidine kinase n=1 Tax=Bacterioplanes sanyensis TaxID=1249553 RepID=A0A222FE37_9GAMM|nr:HAMP domain-containing histidine kinase [Bacterioplanes sanyensis]ASP37278.1 hypothetical protein CHH28_00630 [Bacterioplanes sanyensis]